MGSIYQAVPLNRDVASTNIRVIESLHRDKKGQISCKIRSLSLGRKKPGQKSFDSENDHLGVVARESHQQEEYLALSYAWGPPDTGSLIWIDKKPFKVRKNLWNFLDEACKCRLAAPRSSFSYWSRQPQFLWIDAICIDQSQVEERNHQVAMMGKIYSEARSVLVWLGPSTPAIDDLIQNMYGLKIDEWRRLCWESPVDDKKKTRMQIGIEELCEKDYWERLWVVQEFLLAKKLQLWCGNLLVDPEKIKWLVYTDFKYAHLADSCALELLQGRDWRIASAEQLSFKRYLEFGIRMKCADVRDRVYGLLALINKKERDMLEIRPNYALSPDALFVEICAAMFRSRLDTFDTERELIGCAKTLRQALGLSSDNKAVRAVEQSFNALGYYWDLGKKEEYNRISLAMTDVWKIFLFSEDVPLLTSPGTVWSPRVSSGWTDLHVVP